MSAANSHLSARTPSCIVAASVYVSLLPSYAIDLYSAVVMPLSHVVVGAGALAALGGVAYDMLTHCQQLFVLGV